MGSEQSGTAMHPLYQALLSPWEWRPEILIVLIAFGVMYTTGWARLRTRSSRPKLASWPRLAAYWSGLIILAASLMSPIDRLGGQLFFMHMIQHLLSIMLVAPLLWLAGPFPFMLWSLPQKPRRQVANLFRPSASFRRFLSKATRPMIAWLVFITVYLGWHDPSLYNLALRSSWVHDLQHITFFLAAMLFWWHVIGAAPHIHGRFPGWGRMGYLIGAIPPNMFIGVSIAFSSKVLYTYYESIPRIWGFTTIEDQMLGGAIMWIPGSMMFIITALIVLARMFAGGGYEYDDVRPQWDNEESMIAPGLEHRAVQNKWKRLESTSIQPLDTA